MKKAITSLLQKGSTLVPSVESLIAAGTAAVSSSSSHSSGIASGGGPSVHDAPPSPLKAVFIPVSFEESSPKPLDLEHHEFNEISNPPSYAANLLASKSCVCPSESCPAHTLSGFEEGTLPYDKISSPLSAAKGLAESVWGAPLFDTGPPPPPTRTAPSPPPPPTSQTHPHHTYKLIKGLKGKEGDTNWLDWEFPLVEETTKEGGKAPSSPTSPPPPQNSAKGGVAWVIPPTRL